jgi:protein phosphatase 1 regulatory subunit 7
MSENGIEKIEGLDKLKNLRVLDISMNRISKIENVEHLSDLEEFWGNDNEISDWKEIEKLAHLKKLKCVYFERNPIAQHPQYKRKLVLALPNLEEIDGMPVMKERLLK